MLEKAFYGTKKYWTWMSFLGLIILIGFLFYLKQLSYGLGITGMGRDVTWGFYIAQFTFMVGVAASAVMVVLPYYLHNFKVFSKMTILGEFLAVSAVIMCMLFIFVDMGQPTRVLNVLRYPTPHSLMFWDMMSLGGYLILNVLISRVALDSEKKGIAPPKWIKPFIYLSIPWAISIHTVTAFLYSGLAARPFWLTAVLAPRFLASAFSSGPSLLILMCLIIRKVTKYDVGKEPIQKLALIVTYAMTINIFLILMELFTAFYSGIPEHMNHFKYLLFGLNGHSILVPWMWTSLILGVIALTLLIIPKTRKNETTLVLALIGVFASIWIDKGLGMVVTGFIPSPLEHVLDYSPTFPEVMISLAVWAVGFFLVTVFYKITISYRKAIPEPIKNA